MHHLPYICRMKTPNAREWPYCAIQSFGDPHCMFCGLNLFWPPPPERKIRKHRLEQSTRTRKFPLGPSSAALVSVSPRVVVPWDEGSPEGPATGRVELNSGRGKAKGKTGKKSKPRCAP